MRKAFIRNPVFWIPCSVVFLDWITKLYFNLTLGKPRIARSPFDLLDFLGVMDLIYYPAILLNIVRGQIFNFNVFPHLVHIYVCAADRIVSLLSVFLLILSLWFLYKYIKQNIYWKYLYCIVAGASLANSIEIMISGMAIDWLRINYNFIVTKSIENGPRPGVYGSSTVLNLADVLIYVFTPLTILFCLGQIILKRNVYE